MLFVLTVILITSAVQVFYRDVGHALPLLLQVWMYATPIAYPLTSVPAWLKPIYLLNPMAGIIDGYRRALLHAEHPDFLYLAFAYVVATLIRAPAPMYSSSAPSALSPTSSEPCPISPVKFRPRLEAIPVAPQSCARRSLVHRCQERQRLLGA